MENSRELRHYALGHAMDARNIRSGSVPPIRSLGRLQHVPPRHRGPPQTEICAAAWISCEIGGHPLLIRGRANESSWGETRALSSSMDWIGFRSLYDYSEDGVPIAY